MKTSTLNISGMTCAHCVQAVTKALQAVTGVTSAQVSLEKHEAKISGDADLAQLILAVEAEGYGAQAQ